MLVGALVLLGVFPVAFIARSLILDSTITVCPFKTITGRPCVFCGLTRAFAHATHGDFADAFTLNPLWWVAVLMVVSTAVSLVVAAAVPAQRSSWRIEWWKSPPWMVVGLVVVASLLRAWLGQGDV